MITRKTAFVIGAGASKAYSLPTGEDLRQEIFNMRVNYGFFENECFSTWYNKENYLKFIDTFKFSGLKSIDSFLKRHPEFENEGKACISYIIKTHEMDDYMNLYKKNDWLFLLFNKLVDGITDSESQLVKDSVYIITFNYDRIIEFYLLNSFYNTFNSNSTVKEKFENNGLSNLEDYLKISIDHVYGQIGDLRTNPIDQNGPENIQKGMNEIHIVGDRSPDNERMVSKLNDYERIFFLGYGFDNENNSVLDLKKVCERKQVLGTCYHYFEEEIRKVKKVFPGTPYLLDCDCNDLLRRYL